MDTLIALTYLLAYLHCRVLCVPPRRWNVLRLAAPCTVHGAADRNLRRLTAYELHGGLRWLMVAARGSSNLNWLHRLIISPWVARCSRLAVDTIRYDSGYLTCGKKLTGSQLSLPHGINRKLKCETKNKMMSVISPVRSRYHVQLWLQAFTLP